MPSQDFFGLMAGTIGVLTERHARDISTDIGANNHDHQGENPCGTVVLEHHRGTERAHQRQPGQDQRGPGEILQIVLRSGLQTLRQQFPDHRHQHGRGKCHDRPRNAPRPAGPHDRLAADQDREQGYFDTAVTQTLGDLPAGDGDRDSDHTEPDLGDEDQYQDQRDAECAPDPDGGRQVATRSGVRALGRRPW